MSTTTTGSRPSGRLSRVLILWALALLVMACSDDKKRAPDAALDQVAADSAVLRVSDVPLYSEEPSTSSTGSDAPEGDDPIATCVQQTTGLDLNALKKDRTARSVRTLSSGDGSGQTEIEGSIEIYRDDRLLAQEVGALLNPDVQQCVKSAFQNSFAANDIDLPDLSITVSKLDGVGDEAASILVKGTYSAPGTQAAFTSEVQFVRAGRATVSATVTSFNKEPDHDLGVNAIKAMLQRLRL